MIFNNFDLGYKEGSAYSNCIIYQSKY